MTRTPDLAPDPPSGPVPPRPKKHKKQKSPKQSKSRRTKGLAPGPSAVSIRPVQPEDLDIFFRLFSDPASVTMAGFTSEDPTDRTAFDEHWQSILAAEAVTARSIVADSEVVGNVASFEVDDVTEVTYWIDQRVWGHGIATAALSQLLGYVAVRPIYARAASDNEGSLRVLTKCGFRQVGTERSYANARGEEIEETILRLDAAPSTPGVLS